MTKSYTVIVLTGTKYIIRNGTCAQLVGTTLSVSTARRYYVMVLWMRTARRYYVIDAYSSSILCYRYAQLVDTMLSMRTARRYYVIDAHNLSVLCYRCTQLVGTMLSIYVKCHTRCSQSTFTYNQINNWVTWFFDLQEIIF